MATTQVYIPEHTYLDTLEIAGTMLTSKNEGDFELVNDPSQWSGEGWHAWVCL